LTLISNFLHQLLVSTRVSTKFEVCGFFRVNREHWTDRRTRCNAKCGHLWGPHNNDDIILHVRSANPLCGERLSLNSS